MTRTLKHKGKEFHISVAHYALKNLKKAGFKIDQIDDEPEALEVLFWNSLKAGSWEDEVVIPIKEDEVEFYLDGLYMDFIEVIPDFFRQAEAMTEVKK